MEEQEKERRIDSLARQEPELSQVAKRERNREFNREKWATRGKQAGYGAAIILLGEKFWAWIKTILNG